MRDRLPALKAVIQSSEDWSEFEELTLLSHPKFLDDFFAHVEKIRGMLQKVEEDLDESKRIQCRILENPVDDDGVQAQLANSMNRIKKTLLEIREMLKVMEEGVAQARRESESPAEVRIRTTQHAALSRKLVELLGEMNRSQVDFQERWKARLQRQLEVATRVAVEGEAVEMQAVPGAVGGQQRRLQGPSFWQRM